LNLSESFLSID